MSSILKKRKWIMVLILALAFVLRFYRLGEFPPLNADEAALAYNAKSLIETGMDEHGNPWPIHFQSFNDYKPGLTVYLILPFVKLFGLNIFWIRFLPALLGVVTVLVVYLLVNEILDGTKMENGKWKMANLAALFLAASPWHIHFSRGAWEVNVAAFFITLGLLLFLKGTKSPKFYKYSVVSFVAALYAYHAARLVIPLLGIGLLIIYWKKLWEKKGSVVKALLLGLVLAAPLVKDSFGPAGFSRAAGVGIFSDPGPLNEINEQRGEHQNLSSLGAQVLHNKPINYSLAIAENWAEHYSGDFLFISGDDIQRNKVPEMGQMYLHDILFVLVGFFAVAASYKAFAPILVWLAAAPVAAAFTFQSPHALRSQNMVIPLVIISAYGTLVLINWFRNNFKSKFFLATFYLLLATFIVWSFARYQHLYWIHMPRAYPFSSQYGFEELMDYVEENKDKYNQIVITDRYDQPYILTLFYLDYPPERFQGNHALTERGGFGFSTVREFDEFKFTSMGDWSQITSGYPGALIAGTDEEIPDEANIIKSIEFPNGEPAFQLVEN